MNNEIITSNPVKIGKYTLILQYIDNKGYKLFITNSETEETKEYELKIMEKIPINDLEDLIEDVEITKSLNHYIITKLEEENYKLIEEKHEVEVVKSKLFKSLNSNYLDEILNEKILDGICNTNEKIAERKDALQELNYNKDIAKEIETEIQNKGIYEYYDDIIKNIHIGNNKNIIRKILVGFNIIRGAGSYLSETIAKSGSGKSLEDEIAFLYVMPEENLFIKNDMTVASFTRYDINYFDRKIIYFGDLGSKKSFEKIEDVFNIIKVLISENYYSRDITEKVKGGKYETTNLTLIAKSIGAVYSTVDNSFTQGDKQLESRTVEFTPSKTEEIEDDILEFMFDSNYKLSRKNIAKEKVIKELKKGQEYLKYLLVHKDIDVVVPYKRIFIEYAKKADVPTRELTQQLELFKSYCVLTYFDCRIVNKHYIASQKQFEGYFNNISLENPLKPYESNFLQMIMSKDNKSELTILYEDIESKETIGLNNCFNTVLYDINERQTQRQIDDENEIYLELDDLDYTQEKIFIKKLLNYYGLNSKSSKFTGTNVFFTYNTLKATYKRYNDFKNIEDVGKLLGELHKKGYLDKLDLKHNTQNVYYLTPKCDDIIMSFELNERDIIEAQNFLKNIGIYDEWVNGSSQWVNGSSQWVNGSSQ